MEIYLCKFFSQCNVNLNLLGIWKFGNRFALSFGLFCQPIFGGEGGEHRRDFVVGNKELNAAAKDRPSISRKAGGHALLARRNF